MSWPEMQPGLPVRIREIAIPEAAYFEPPLSRAVASDLVLGSFPLPFPWANSTAHAPW
jgi:hypothetical protein